MSDCKNPSHAELVRLRTEAVMEANALTERVGELTQLNRKLVDALGDVFALMSFESGPFLGRITDHDGEPGWAMRMIEPMAKLKAAHAVLDEAKEALNSSPRQAYSVNDKGEPICIGSGIPRMGISCACPKCVSSNEGKQEK